MAAAGESLAVTGGALWAGPGRYWPRGELHIQDGRVAYAGPADGAPPHAAPVLDAGGGLIMPGLVNAHCHGPMVLFRGLADDLPLETWLTQHMFPAEARWVSEGMTETAGLVAAAEMLLSGTTCLHDSYFCAHGMARAYARAGLRAVVTQGVIGFPAPGVPDPSHGVEVAREFIEEWQGKSPLITPAVFAHSLYTCPPETIQAVAALAGKLGVTWHVHLAETKAEVEEVASRFGMSPARHLEALGVLEGLCAGVHGVWLDEEEWELLVRRGVALVHCPESNAKLASGLAPVRRWLRAGLSVGLGTDGAASNNDLDMLGEVGSTHRLAALAAGEADAVSPESALDLALTGSARAMGLDGVVGRLEPGYAGDAIVVETSAPHLAPWGEPLAGLVHRGAGGDVRHTVVAGRVVVRDREVLAFDVGAAQAELVAMAAEVARQDQAPA